MVNKAFKFGRSASLLQAVAMLSLVSACVGAPASEEAEELVDEAAQELGRTEKVATVSSATGHSVSYAGGFGVYSTNPGGGCGPIEVLELKPGARPNPAVPNTGTGCKLIGETLLAGAALFYEDVTNDDLRGVSLRDDKLADTRHIGAHHGLFFVNDSLLWADDRGIMVLTGGKVTTAKAGVGIDLWAVLPAVTYSVYDGSFSSLRVIDSTGHDRIVASAIVGRITQLELNSTTVFYSTNDPSVFGGNHIYRLGAHGPELVLATPSATFVHSFAVNDSFLYWSEAGIGEDFAKIKRRANPNGVGAVTDTGKFGSHLLVGPANLYWLSESDVLRGAVP